MSSDTPAWLWDGERARIVWANPQGVRWFGGETLFDLIDQPFDAEDEAVVRIRALAHDLPSGETARETLRLPSAAGEAAARCRCSVHRLADGRPGLLVALEDGAQVERLPQVLANAMLMALPLGALLVSAEGKVRFANTAARTLVEADRFDSLARLIADGDSAKRLLSQASAMRLASAVVPIPTRYGRREIRVTAKLMEPAVGAGGAILMLLDDVTDRRILERALAGAGAPGVKAVPATAGGTPTSATAEAHRLDEAERRTFEALAAAILRGAETPADGGLDVSSDVLRPGSPGPADASAETRSLVIDSIPNVQPEDAESSASLTTPRIAPVETGTIEPHPVEPHGTVPALVSRALDALPHVIVLHRGAEVLFANRAAVAALGFTDQPDLLAHRALGERLAQADSGEISLTIADGTEMPFRLTRSSFPWNTGPVSQSALEPVAAAAPPPAPVEPDEPDEILPESAPEGPEQRGALAAAEAPKPTGLARLAWEPVDAELRAILDTATDGIITLDENGHIRGFSAGAEALFGYRLADVAGRPFTDLLGPESRKVVRNYLAALDHSGLASVFNDGREVEAVVAQGTVPLFIAIGRIGATSSTAAGTTGGGGQAYCVVVRDLTQWKKTEAELRRAKEEAERASAQKSEFLANISHELRTPLNAILGFSEVMRSQRFGALSNQRYLGYANDIHESGEHLLSLINDLLDLSKVEAGKLELNFTSVNLAALVDQCLAVLQDHAAAGQVVLRKNIPAGLPNVVADQRSVKQILLNLISNAVKFTDPGGQVIVSARLARTGELKISVKDTGIGMSEAELQAAVQPFKRIESPGREQAPGTGLGLPLSRALTEANRATFAISSERRKGTLVEITFPTTRVLAG
jgi:PAS domain S-box-containing protein